MSLAPSGEQKEGFTPENVGKTHVGQLAYEQSDTRVHCIMKMHQQL